MKKQMLITKLFHKIAKDHFYYSPKREPQPKYDPSYFIPRNDSKYDNTVFTFDRSVMRQFDLPR